MSTKNATIWTQSDMDVLFFCVWWFQSGTERNTTIEKLFVTILGSRFGVSLKRMLLRNPPHLRFQHLPQGRKYLDLGPQPVRLPLNDPKKPAEYAALWF